MLVGSFGEMSDQFNKKCGRNEFNYKSCKIFSTFIFNSDKLVTDLRREKCRKASLDYDTRKILSTFLFSIEFNLQYCYCVSILRKIHDYSEYKDFSPKWEIDSHF